MLKWRGEGRGGIHNLSDCLLPHKRKAHDYLCGWVTQDVMNCVREGRGYGSVSYHHPFACVFWWGQEEVGVEELLLCGTYWGLVLMFREAVVAVAAIAAGGLLGPAVFLDQNKKERTHSSVVDGMMIPNILYFVTNFCNELDFD